MDTMRSAFATLKAQGFCDHLGFSCHTSPQVAMHAITKYDDFEVMMVPYCPLRPAAQTDLLPGAKAKGVGTIGMKPFGGGGGFLNQVWSADVKNPKTDQWRHSSRPYEAALRWVMKNRDLDCTVPGAHAIEQIDELFNAVSGTFTEDDEDVLILQRKFDLWNAATDA